ncbi:hypothetical protein F511_07358 [Dorcoceras hygrometricum]|uniref:Uncharacterized protein n=1 Tax=Dorcoceras hygrometricum TaxID=472368 RepID=A0A2Z7BBW5_9LAMI|nr:hypothetical protein F511_07358 [Dorcoceras hygrometricum]
MAGKANPRKPSTGGGTNLASCTLATIFLIFLIIIVLILYFTVIKPKEPNLTVNAVQIPSFSVVNATVRFTFSQYVTVSNPNRAVFTHYDSSVQLLYGGSQVGFMFIPAGKVSAGKTQYMAATFSVQPIPMATAAGGVKGQSEEAGPTGLSGQRFGAIMEVQSRIEMTGRVRILHFFNHHVVTRVECRVAIGVSDGSVLAFHC